MDFGERAAAVETKDRQMSLEALKRRAAIKKLRGGSLTCMDCSDLIPEKRREAEPTCEYCVTCQGKREE